MTFRTRSGCAAGWPYENNDYLTYFIFTKDTADTLERAVKLSGPMLKVISNFNWHQETPMCLLRCRAACALMPPKRDKQPFGAQILKTFRKGTKAGKLIFE
jgi:hypothetical protein